ncbi:MAG: bifunctional folylpolyglutamate synthase/dihydrofolate synthase [Bacteroidales bacterium]|nr:bifunctional folylpolyglutamate synthase/dihydrofolate synthase [Bacteroidales bacterium]
MQYEKKIEEIFERHPSVQVNGFSGRAYKAGIDGMLAFDATLGHPWKSFRCIHVAGTNGKGSVSSMLAAVLASRGLRVGLYTSPHLVDFRERIKVIDGSESPHPTDNDCHFERSREISKDDVIEFLEKYEKETEELSFFEITTGMAFWWFEKEKVDVAVIEVGLGGRLDSTNVITPELSVVTSIGLDHCSMLGDTRAEIAYEKAGIFKPGVPALVWGHDTETDSVFIRHASKVGAKLYFADELVEPVHIDGMDLRGEYQDANVRTAIAALRVLGIEPDLEAIRHTAAITGLRGRWEVLRTRPTVICDIGHNPPALAQNFRQLEKMPDLIIVYGIMADKALDDIAPLMPFGARYILCAPDSPRSMPVDILHQRLAALRPDLHLQTAPSVADAVRLALTLSTPDTTIYIGGSTFVVSEAIAPQSRIFPD